MPVNLSSLTLQLARATRGSLQEMLCNVLIHVIGFFLRGAKGIRPFKLQRTPLLYQTDHTALQGALLRCSNGVAWTIKGMSGIKQLCNISSGDQRTVVCDFRQHLKARIGTYLFYIGYPQGPQVQLPIVPQVAHGCIQQEEYTLEQAELGLSRYVHQS